MNRVPLQQCARASLLALTNLVVQRVLAGYDGYERGLELRGLAKELALGAHVLVEQELRLCQRDARLLERGARFRERRHRLR
jgi:hypothetical protein